MTLHTALPRATVQTQARASGMPHDVGAAGDVIDEPPGIASDATANAASCEAVERKQQLPGGIKKGRRWNRRFRDDPEPFVAHAGAEVGAFEGIFCGSVDPGPPPGLVGTTAAESQAATTIVQEIQYHGPMDGPSLPPGLCGPPPGLEFVLSGHGKNDHSFAEDSDVYMRSVSETSDSDLKDARDSKEISSPASENGDGDSATDSTASGTSPASVNSDGDSVTDTTAPGTPASKAKSAMPQPVLEETVESKGKNAKKNQRRKAKKAEAKALAPLMVAAAEAAQAAGPPTILDFGAQVARRPYSDLSIDERSKLKTSLLNMIRAEDALKSAKVEEVMRDDAAKVPLGCLTPLQLAEYGPAADRILVSVYGDIFDVSNERDKYGTGGSKMEFAGKDLTWNLVCAGMGDTNLFFDLYKAEKKSDVHDMLNCLCRWLLLFEKRHGQPVGRLVVYGNMEKELAPPPPKETECSIM